MFSSSFDYTTPRAIILPTAIPKSVRLSLPHFIATILHTINALGTKAGIAPAFELSACLLWSVAKLLSSSVLTS